MSASDLKPPKIRKLWVLSHSRNFWWRSWHLSRIRIDVQIEDMWNAPVWYFSFKWSNVRLQMTLLLTYWTMNWNVVLWAAFSSMVRVSLTVACRRHDYIAVLLHIRPCCLFVIRFFPQKDICHRITALSVLTSFFFFFSFFFFDEFTSPPSVCLFVCLFVFSKFCRHS